MLSVRIPWDMWILFEDYEIYIDRCSITNHFDIITIAKHISITYLKFSVKLCILPKTVKETYINLWQIHCNLLSYHNIDTLCFICSILFSHTYKSLLMPFNFNHRYMRVYTGMYVCMPICTLLFNKGTTNSVYNDFQLGFHK